MAKQLKIKCLSCGVIEKVPSPYCLLCAKCTFKNIEAWELKVYAESVVEEADKDVH